LESSEVDKESDPIKLGSMEQQAIYVCRHIVQNTMEKSVMNALSFNTLGYRLADPIAIVYWMQQSN